MSELVLEPLVDYVWRRGDELCGRAREFHAAIKSRRTVRDFSDRPVPAEVIELALATAGTAPSGANLQPWHFVVIADPKTKRRVMRGSRNRLARSARGYEVAASPTAAGVQVLGSSKPASQWLPSQNGLFLDAPQRHSV
jgi:nitroreductase